MIVYTFQIGGVYKYEKQIPSPLFIPFKLGVFTTNSTLNNYKLPLFIPFKLGVFTTYFVINYVVQ
jgi:hypothetical protein